MLWYCLQSSAVGGGGRPKLSESVDWTPDTTAIDVIRFSNVLVFSLLKLHARLCWYRWGNLERGHTEAPKRLSDLQTHGTATVTGGYNIGDMQYDSLN